MLEVKRVTKKFGGLVAVNNVSFKLEEGEILGLIGPNGSGKTTIFNLITGFLGPTTGEVLFNGNNIVSQKPHEIVRLGISRTFQITSILSELTVEENIASGFLSNMELGLLDVFIRGKKYKVQENKAKDQVEKILDFISLNNRKKELAKNITAEEQRKLMMGIALARNPKILLLDEPAAGTTREEQKELIKMIKKINVSGVTVILIEHHMNVVMNACDRIVALNFGNKIGDGLPKEIQNNSDVIEAYLGKDDTHS